MYKVSLKKPDGRDLFLYSRRPIAPDIEATSPSQEAVPAQSHLRWHPFRGEWVAYASHRQNRTFLPSAAANPLAETEPGKPPTELPRGDYDVAVFDNRFATLSPHPQPEVTLAGVKTERAVGVCEVVVFTKDANASLTTLPLDHIALLIDVWADRYVAIGSLPSIKYVMCFENRGVEMGVTLHHPHGQIYAYPLVPPVQAREGKELAQHYRAHGRTLMQDTLENELREKSRILYEGPHAIAFMPPFARYPYEAWVAPRRNAPSLDALTTEERLDLAKALKTTLMKYDGLWQRPFPYLMIFHQAPTDGQSYPEWHMYIEFSPPYRSQDRLKYLAGTELGAGFFANDALPEEKVKELQAVKVDFR